jgi:hypothetical protein
MRLDANGSFDPTFGKNGFSSLFNIHQCSGSPIKYYYKPNEIIYERIGNNLVVSYFVVNCGDYLLNNWTRITENGIALNSIYTQDSSFFYPNQVSLPNQFNLVGSVREQYYMHNLMLHMSFLTKVDVNGNIDHSFGDNGTLYGEKGIFYGGTFPVYYFESVEPISDTKLWYVRNANDTIYLSYILQPKPYGLIISANKQDIGFGDTVRFSAESYQPILNYHWRFAGASIRYLNGTDSSSANPMVQFIHSGRFDVTLQADLADTILTSTNKNYILLTPSIDFTKSKTLVYVNDSLNFQSVYKGYPNSFLWQISPNINPFIMGSDSSTRNSSIKIIEPGKYNVRLTLNYTDTTISLLKQDYFVASWPARLNSSVKVTKLNIYPNPTNTSFYIISDNIDEMLVCEIIDPQGRSIQTLQINPKEHSAISLPAQAGIYLIRLSNLDGKTWLAKVVKE